MPVTVKVNGTANSLVHKGSNGISMATIPDVCKTPSPGGPVPIPYPNISQSATLAKGTTTVKADGMMIAIKGSEFSLSNGDNAGVAGGVKSSTFMKESTWILYSFDVKMDGQNAARLTDKKFQNHENTVDLAGTVQKPVVQIPTGLTVEEMIACAILCCDKANYDMAKNAKYDEGTNCRRLSNRKHSCLMHSLRRSPDAVKAGIKASPRFPPKGKTKRIPDVMFGDPSIGQGRIVDGKFPCKKPMPSSLKGASHVSDDKAGLLMLTAKEKRSYNKLGVPPGQQQNDVEAWTPKDAEETLDKNPAAKQACDCQKITTYEKVKKK